MAYHPNMNKPDPADDGLYPDADRSDGVGNDDEGLNPDVDQDDGVDSPATSLGAAVGYQPDDDDRPVVPGEVRTDRFGNVIIGAPAARAASFVNIPL